MDEKGKRKKAQNKFKKKLKGKRDVWMSADVGNR